MWRLCAVLAGVTGCSLAVVARPPQLLPDRGPIACTADSIAPRVDVALGIASALAAIAATYYVAATPWDDNGPTVIPTFHRVAFPFVFAGLGSLMVVPLAFFGSARDGERAIASCREVQARRDREDRERRVATDAAADDEARQLRALELVAAGQAAARRGDCVAAIAIGERIRAIDPATLADYDVAACRR